MTAVTKAVTVDGAELDRLRDRLDEFQGNVMELTESIRGLERSAYRLVPTEDSTPREVSERDGSTFLASIHVHAIASAAIATGLDSLSVDLSRLVREGAA